MGLKDLLTPGSFAFFDAACLKVAVRSGRVNGRQVRPRRAGRPDLRLSMELGPALCDRARDEKLLDAAEQLIYERRLRQAQPTGWFVTSNVYGSIMLFALVCWTGLAIASARAGQVEA